MLRTLLLTAALLVLAGCIDVFQDSLADEHADDAPNIAFVDSEAEDQIVVNQAGPNLRWSDFNLTGDRPASFRLNERAARQFGVTRSTVVGSGALAAGDKIDFCLVEPGTLEIRLLYTPQNTILHVYTFETVATHEYCR